MTQHNHSIVRRSAKVLAAIAAFSIAIVTVFSFAACQRQPASADGTPAPQPPAAEASPAAVPTAPPATAVPVFSGYTNACQPVKVTFPSAGSASAFSVNFVLPEGWTVKAETDGASARSKTPPQPHSRRTTPCSLSLSFPTALTTPQGLPLILRKISGLSKNFEGFMYEEDIEFDYHLFNAQRVAGFMLPMNIDRIITKSELTKILYNKLI